MWVNDLIILEKEMTEIEQLKRNLNAEFEMKDMRELRYFFNIKVIRDHENVNLSSIKIFTFAWFSKDSIWKIAISHLHQSL